MYKSPEIFIKNSFHQIMARVRKKRITTISSAPGTGKTSLVEYYLENIDLPVFWHTFKKDLNDSSNLTEELNNFMRANNLYDKKNNKGAFLILDCQSAIQELEGTNYVVTLISKLPRHIHIILLCSYPPNWVTVANSTNWDMLKVTGEQFIFNLKESRSFYKEIFNIELNNEQNQSIYSLTEGWVAAMVAIGKFMITEAEWEKFLSVNPYTVLKSLPDISFYLERAFDSYTIKEEEILLYTSLLEEFSIDEGCLLAGEEARVILPEMRDKGLFLKYEAATNNYKCHVLFREFLLTKALNILGAEAINELHCKLADYYYRQNKWKAAFDMYIKGANIYAAIEVLKKAGPQVMNEQQSDTIRNLLSRIPINEFRNNPWLNYASACLFRFREAALCYKYLEDALKGFRNNSDIDGEVLTLCLQLEVLMFYPGEIAGMKSLILELPKKLNPNSDEEIKLAGYRMVYAALAHCYLTGNLNEAVELSETAMELSFKIQDNNLNLWACVAMMVATSYIGIFEVARGHIAEAFKVRNYPDTDEIIAANVPFIAGLSRFYSGNFKEAVIYLEEALQESASLRLEVLDFYILRFMVLLEAYKGERYKSDKYLAEMKSKVERYLKPNNHHLNSFLLLTRAEHRYLWGLDHRAAELARQAVEQRLKAGGEYYLTQSYLILGVSLVEIGNFAEGQLFLEKAVVKAIETNSVYMEISAYVHLAISFLRQNEEVRFKHMAEKAFSYGEKYSYTFFYGWRDDNMLELITKAREFLPQIGYLDELISRINDKVADPIAKGDKNTTVIPKSALIRISLLGLLTIEVEGQLLKKLTNRKPLTLLKLLAIHDKPLSMEKIVAEMWPDLEVTEARNNFYFTIHQLRKLLNSKAAIIYKDGFCSLNSELCLVDLHLFHQWAAAGEKLYLDGQQDEALEKLQAAQRLYKGALLENEQLSDILFWKRESLAKKFYQLLILSGELYIEKLYYKNAIEVLNKACEQEWAEEYAYRLLMLAYYYNGERMQAIEVYNKLTIYLKRYLGIEPSKLTTDLNTAIKNDAQIPISSRRRWLTNAE